MIENHGALVEWSLTGKAKVVGEKSSPVPTGYQMIRGRPARNSATNLLKRARRRHETQSGSEVTLYGISLSPF
jgi:hypothetical protein